MAKRWRVPDGFVPSARIQASGAVQTQGIEIYSPLLAKALCRIVLEVGDENCECVAYGELATELSSIPAGTVLTVDGTFRLHNGTCTIVVDSMRKE